MHVSKLRLGSYLTHYIPAWLYGYTSKHTCHLKQVFHQPRRIFHGTRSNTVEVVDCERPNLDVIGEQAFGL